MFLFFSFLFFLSLLFLSFSFLAFFSPVSSSLSPEHPSRLPLSRSPSTSRRHHFQPLHHRASETHLYLAALMHHVGLTPHFGYYPSLWPNFRKVLLPCLLLLMFICYIEGNVSFRCGGRSVVVLVLLVFSFYFFPLFLVSYLSIFHSFSFILFSA